jgi:uncharacterized membrane protein
VRGSLTIEQVVEAVLSAGIVASTLLLGTGLLLDLSEALRWGILILMATPVARVAILTAGLLLRRDFVFAGLSLFVLGVLAMGILRGGR